ncbi:small membrane protein [Streptomyces albospinus]|uniref:Small membrane protein n=1 Tax=Streptomyces albospinus TaxID=285515 RepID=A0ABQ2VIY5_9ACTN|nr:chaplin [Streptomyces albospinus]GGU88802.1 small membrane protein [Streptomyces albospinus]
MKRFIKTAAMVAVTSTMVLGGAGVASASDGGHRHGHHGRGFEEKRRHGRGATAIGFAKHSPGVLSGNVIQVPIDIPINVCGNTVDVFIALLNPAFGNVCINK